MRSLHVVVTGIHDPGRLGDELSPARVHNRPGIPVLLASGRPPIRNLSRVAHAMAYGRHIGFRAKPFRRGERHGVMAAPRESPAPGAR